MRSLNLSLAIVFICYITLASYINPAFAQNTPQNFVDAHNKARTDLAAGLPLMIWNQTLQTYAQNYADAVRNANTCNSLVHSKGPYGENLAAGYPDMTGQKAVELWVAEKTDYNYPANTCNAGKVCGHYTQIVWRKSVRLGCARVQCANGWTYVICSYDLPGNYIGQLPY